MRIITDMVKFCTKNMPKYTLFQLVDIISERLEQQHSQELAFTLANGFHILTTPLRKVES